MDAKHPNQIAKNSPNSLVNIIFGGDHEVMKKLAFGNQEIDTSDPYADNIYIKLMPAITDWAKDTYRFCCRLWGEENIIGCDVHCDETGVHAHVLTVPVERVRKRGRIGSKYVHKDNPDKVLSTKEWKALPKEERADYIKSEQPKDSVERVSYAKVWVKQPKTSRSICQIFIPNTTMRWAASMACSEASHTMNCLQRKCVDAYIRLLLKLNDKRN